jgi:prepilin-type N-terminal cleavage/methylation domain-containing protein
MRQRGFTLLEVLAAVAILGILYVVLADVAMQGLLSEGRSRRRLEASLVADQKLSDIEIELASGSPPPDGRSEEEQEHYTVVVDAQPYAVPLPPEESDPGAPQLPPAPISEGMSSLREIVVTVSWLEGENEHQISRTTYGYDAAAFAAAVPLDTGDDTGQDDRPEEDGPGGVPTLEDLGVAE